MQQIQQIQQIRGCMSVPKTAWVWTRPESPRQRARTRGAGGVLSSGGAIGDHGDTATSPQPGARMEFDTAALPVRWLRSAPVRDPPAFADAPRWQAMLLEAGLLTDVPPPVDDEDPRAWIAGVQQLLRELAAAEEKIQGLQTRFWDIQWKGFRDLPFSMIALIVVVPWLTGSLVYAFPELFGGHMVEMLLLGLLPFVSLSIVKNLERVRLIVSRDYRKLQLKSARAARDQLRAELKRGVAATLDRSFVARGGPGLIARTADLDWLQKRASAARRAQEPTVLAALEAEIQAIRAATQTALEAPPEHWTAAGMCTDRTQWSTPATPPPPASPPATAARAGET